METCWIEWSRKRWDPTLELVAVVSRIHLHHHHQLLHLHPHTTLLGSPPLQHLLALLHGVLALTMELDQIIL